MKLRHKIPLWALVLGIGQVLVTGGFPVKEEASAKHGATQQAGLPGGGVIPSAPTKLCPAGCPHYPGDRAPQAARAAWMGSAAQHRGLPAELPVMASLVESSLRNLNYGDADSVGLFQMRVSIWNSGPYAGYANKPALQLDWFLDHAVAVKRIRVAQGLPLTPGHYGQWAADVEQPAAQYRYRYQERLPEARTLLAQASK